MHRILLQVWFRQWSSIHLTFLATKWNFLWNPTCLKFLITFNCLRSLSLISISKNPICIATIILYFWCWDSWLWCKRADFFFDHLITQQENLRHFCPLSYLKIFWNAWTNFWGISEFKIGVMLRKVCVGDLIKCHLLN